MIYWKLIVADQSYEVSYQDINFVLCPIMFSSLLRVDTEKINLLEKIGE